MKTYRITLTGVTPLLMHADSIEWADRMEKWKNSPSNKKTSKAGDDRTPAFRWIGYLYRSDAGQVVLPTENIMRAIMEGATSVPVPGGKGGKTFKTQSQSGIIPRDVGWPILINGKPLSFEPLAALMEEPDFEKHQQKAVDLGFSLFLKRAKINNSKHIRVRPRFDTWAASGELVVTDPQITKDVLRDILEIAGSKKGLGDWRPSSKTPGTFGMFRAGIEEVKS